MPVNISYNNEGLPNSLDGLAALRKTITARLTSGNQKLYTCDREISLLKRQNKLLKDHLYQQVLLLEHLNRQKHSRF